MTNLQSADVFAEYRQTCSREPNTCYIDGHPWSPFGVRMPSNDPSADLDDRYFERSALRFSPYFQRMRHLRSKTELYTKYGILPQRYCSEHPLPYGDTEIYCEARLEICDEYKKVQLNCGTEITVFSNGCVQLVNAYIEIPELILLRDTFLPSVDVPCCDFLISRGVMPEIINRTFRVSSFVDTLTVNGGEFSIIFNVISFGNIAETIGVDLKLYDRSVKENTI